MADMTKAERLALDLAFDLLAANGIMKSSDTPNAANMAAKLLPVTKLLTAQSESNKKLRKQNKRMVKGIKKVNKMQAMVEKSMCGIPGVVTPRPGVLETYLARRPKGLITPSEEREDQRGRRDFERLVAFRPHLASPWAAFDSVNGTDRNKEVARHEQPPNWHPEA